MNEQEGTSGPTAGSKIFGQDTDKIIAMLKMAMENKDSVKQLVDIFSPVLSEALDLIMDTVGPQAHKAGLRIALGSADIKAKLFAEYFTKHKFSREEAMRLVLADMKAYEGIGKAASDTVGNTKK